MSEQTPPRSTVTPAQRAVLDVLAATDPKRVRGGKRRSDLRPIPHVNTRAADSLVDCGLVKCHWVHYGGLYSTAYEYTLTEAGRGAAR